MDKTFLRELISNGATADKCYFEYATIVACNLDRRLHEQLFQIINGPVSDGDVIDKSLRDILIDLGLVMRVCVNGAQGFTGGSYFAYTVCEKIKEINEGKIGV
jgi:hypothetical protein